MKQADCYEEKYNKIACVGVGGCIHIYSETQLQRTTLTQIQCSKSQVLILPNAFFLLIKLDTIY